MSLLDKEVSEFLSYPKSDREAALRRLREAAKRDDAHRDRRNRQRRPDCEPCAPCPPGRGTSAVIDVAQEMGPNALASAGPADATIASSGQVNDTSVVQDAGGLRKQQIQSVYLCPLCDRWLAKDGSCGPCKVQFVGIEQKVADRLDFNLRKADADGKASPPAYRSCWDIDDEGFAIMCFENRATGWRVWIPCFVDYVDTFDGKKNRFPYWFKPQRFDAVTVQTLAGLTDEQFKERAAHLPGRTAEHVRMYDSNTFQREYYWVFMDRPGQWQTRVERKQIILAHHRRAGCADDCTKRHRPQAH